MLVDGSIADLAVVGFSAFMIVAGCVKLFERPANRPTKAAQTTKKTSVPAAIQMSRAIPPSMTKSLAPAAQLAKLNIIIEKAVATANAASVNQAAASVQIDAAEMAFNRLLREIGGVMRLDIRPTVDIRHHRAEPAMEADVRNVRSSALAA